MTFDSDQYEARREIEKQEKQAKEEEQRILKMSPLERRLYVRKRAKEGIGYPLPHITEEELLEILNDEDYNFETKVKEALRLILERIDSIEPKNKRTIHI